MKITSPNEVYHKMTMTLRALQNIIIKIQIIETQGFLTKTST